MKRRQHLVGGGSSIHKFTTPGELLDGKWRGIHDGKYGPLGTLGTLDTETGPIVFPLHTALLKRMQLIRVGADVTIEYLGKQTTKAGKEFHNFHTYVDDPEKDTVPEGTSQPDEDEVPF